MTKVVFGFFLIFILSVAAAASATENCFDQVAKNQKWAPLTAEQKDCVQKDAEFTTGMQFLCNSDQSDISIPYSKYISYKAQYEKAFTEYRNTVYPGSRNVALMKLREIETDWMAFGYRHEVSMRLNIVDGVKYYCTH